MQSDSSANRTWSEWTSAVEWTATVLMPSSRAARMMRSAISPRFAMRILENKSHRLEAEERLAQAARTLRLDLVHQLHRLDDAEHLPLLHHRSHLDEGGALGRGGAVESADERRVDGEGRVLDRLLGRRGRGGSG